MSGSIRQLKNDYWLLRVDQGRDPLTGRRIQASKTVSGNRKAAERALDELKFTIRNQITTPSTLTLSVLIDLWAESLTKNGRKRSTSSLYHTRKRALRARGWDFHRIWSDHWFANPEVEVERALAAIQRSFAAS